MFNFYLLFFIRGSLAEFSTLLEFKQWYFIKHNEEISELKFFKLIASMKQEIKGIIKKQKAAIADFLDQLADIIERTCVKEQKKNKLKPLTILRNLS